MQTAVPFACFLSMIRPPGVQYENSLLQIAPVDKAKCPFVKSGNDVAFQLFTRHNPTVYQDLVLDDDEKLFASNIDFHDNTVLFFHAWMEQPDDGSGVMVREAYMQRGDTNVIMVDARRLEAGPWYATAAQNTWYIGRYTAQFIDYLVTRGLNLNNTHLIGHSLGAQAAGVAGSALKSGRVSRITGLDPALPLFDHIPMSQRLDPSDAEFVDVIHTDAGIFGYKAPMGHVDFYPNGGISPQPGCELEVVIPQQMLLNKCVTDRHTQGFYTYYLTDRTLNSESIYIENKIQYATLPDVDTVSTDVKILLTDVKILPIDVKASDNVISTLNTKGETVKRLERSKRSALETSTEKDSNTTERNATIKYINELIEESNKIIINKNLTEDSTKDVEDKVANINKEKDKTELKNLNKNKEKQVQPIKINFINSNPIPRIILRTILSQRNNKNGKSNNLFTKLFPSSKRQKKRLSIPRLTKRKLFVNNNEQTNTNIFQKLLSKPEQNVNNALKKQTTQEQTSNLLKKITKPLKRQKRFLSFFKRSEDENIIFKLLDFLIKNRKNVLPVLTVMREINTFVKSANGELNHFSKESNNYIGVTPPVITPVAYTLELGNEGRLMAFVKKIFGLAPKGDRLTIGG